MRNPRPRPSWKVVLTAILVIPLGLVAWIASYRCENPKLAAQLRADAESRVRERDKLVKDNPDNGFEEVAHDFYHHTDDFLAMLPWSRTARAENVPMKSQPGEFEAARKRYEQHLPILRQELAKKHFVWFSDWDHGVTANVPDLRELRKISHSAAGYADYLRLQGRSGEALDHLMLHLAMGAKVAAQGPLYSHMVGLSMQAICEDVILDTLNLDRLSEAELRTLLTRLQAMPSTTAQFLERMDEDYAAQMVTLDLAVKGAGIRGGDELPEAITLLANWSGWMERERRVLQNLHLKLRPSYEKMEILEDVGAGDSDDFVPAFAATHHSKFIEWLAPHKASATRFVCGAAARRSGIVILTALQLHKAEKGNYPLALADLVPAYLPALPRDWSSKDGTFEYQCDGDEFTLSSHRRLGMPAANTRPKVTLWPYKIRWDLI